MLWVGALRLAIFLLLRAGFSIANNEAFLLPPSKNFLKPQQCACQHDELARIADQVGESAYF